MAIDAALLDTAGLPERRPRAAARGDARRRRRARVHICASDLPDRRTASRCCCSTRRRRARTASASRRPRPSYMSFDEALLDDPAQLEQRDEQRLLSRWPRPAPRCGGRSTRSATSASRRCATGELPRALLVATDSAPSSASRLITRLSCTRTPSLTWHGVELPRWAGAGRRAAHRLGRRPAPAARGAGRRRARSAGWPWPSWRRPAARSPSRPGAAPLHELPRDLHPRAARWSVLTPLLQALDALGVNPIPSGLLVEVADALDQQAEVCRPDGDAFTNPAKALAIEFADADPADRRGRRAGRRGRPGDLRRAAAVRRRLVGVGVAARRRRARRLAAARRRPGAGATTSSATASTSRSSTPAAAAGRRRRRLGRRHAAGRALRRPDPARRGGRPPGGRGAARPGRQPRPALVERGRARPATRWPASPRPPRSASSPPPTSPSASASTPARAARPSATTDVDRPATRTGAAVSASGGSKAIIAALGRQPRHRRDQVRRVRDHRLVVDAGRGRALGRRLRQPGAAAARRPLGAARRRRPSIRSATAATATSTASSSR